jgi:hypothetical protein
MEVLPQLQQQRKKRRKKKKRWTLEVVWICLEERKAVVAEEVETIKQKKFFTTKHGSDNLHFS